MSAFLIGFATFMALVGAMLLKNAWRFDRLPAWDKRQRREALWLISVAMALAAATFVGRMFE